ncbi:uncharacterized protein LOC111622882 [Centruroides sculpturatus]|uniref:uncharacterized protein LOC111618119 n=1 Tax=Centruroides sculpturatus TaxID=218467 RepID=UPI000C6DEF60|nr:uncharacterized protein LOC111618119 [Centruroides sculpturatus]XP_023221107.1 uncharacterized protein LOC111622882 [Centruroides sculpturatus]
MQKVCTACRPISELIAKSREQQAKCKQEAAIGLDSMTKNIDNLVQVIESGGVQTLIFLAAHDDDIIKEAVAQSLNTLTQQMALIPLLKISGAIKALKHFLATSQDKVKIVNNSLSALALFCKCFEDKVTVLQEGTTQPLLELLENPDTTSLLAARIICCLTENPDLHPMLLQNPSALYKILNSLKTDDLQKKEILMKILAYLSTGQENLRLRLIQEDQVNGYPILNALRGDTKNTSLLQSTVCLIGNLATILGDQNALQSYLTEVANLLENYSEGPKELVLQIARTLANFSEFPPSSLLLVQRIQPVINILLRSEVESIRMHACRIIVSLWNTEPSLTLNELMRNGVDTFLEEMFAVDGVISVLINVFLRKTSRLSFPP